MSLDPEDAAAVVRAFWQRMATNDFASVAELLAPGFVLDWPQSRERIRGAAAFVRMNAEYPSHGPWRFTLHRLVADGGQVVTHVGVTDGVQCGEAISFFRVEGGRIAAVVEFWPDPFPPAQNRRHLVERMPD